jgi:hypothetical protein
VEEFSRERSLEDRVDDRANINGVVLPGYGDDRFHALVDAFLDASPAGR